MIEAGSIMEKIGFIGLGRMGLPMASNLVSGNYLVYGFDTDSNQLRRASNNGCVRCSSIAEVVEKTDIIVTMLPNSKNVEEVYFSPDGGIFPHTDKDKLVMDMSTVSPATTDLVAAEAAARRIEFLDAPVGRLASHADAGESLFMVGGSEIGFKRVEPLLKLMGSDIFHCGEAGAGTRTKLVNNFLAISYCQMNAEALSLMQVFGLELEKTLDVLYGTTATNGQLKVAWPSKVLLGDTSPGFTIDLAHKDLSLVVEAANDQSLSMPMAAAAREAFNLARRRGFGQKDFSAMLEQHCELHNLEKPRRL